MANALTNAVTSLKNALSALGVDLNQAVPLRIVVPLESERALVAANLVAGGQTVTSGDIYDAAMGCEFGCAETREADVKRVIRRVERTAYQSGVKARAAIPKSPIDIGGDNPGENTSR